MGLGTFYICFCWYLVKCHHSTFVVRTYLFSQILNFCDPSHLYHFIFTLTHFLWHYLWPFIFVVNCALFALPYINFTANNTSHICYIIYIRHIYNFYINCFNNINYFFKHFYYITSNASHYFNTFNLCTTIPFFYLLIMTFLCHNIYILIMTGFTIYVTTSIYSLLRYHHFITAIILFL